MKCTVIETAKVEGNIAESPSTKCLDLCFDNNNEGLDAVVEETAATVYLEEK